MASNGTVDVTRREFESFKEDTETAIRGVASAVKEIHESDRKRMDLHHSRIDDLEGWRDFTRGVLAAYGTMLGVIGVAGTVIGILAVVGAL